MMGDTEVGGLRSCNTVNFLEEILVSCLVLINNDPKITRDLRITNKILESIWATSVFINVYFCYANDVLVSNGGACPVSG